MKKIFFAIVVLVSVLPGWSAVKVDNLRCEYLLEPIGLDASPLRLTWETSGDGDITSIWVEVRDHDTDAIVWTSGALSPSTRRAEAAFNAKPHKRYDWNVKAFYDGDTRLAIASSQFETGKLSPADWSASWISDSLDREFEPAPVFRKEFTVSPGMREGRMYVSAAGYYVVYINGERVGDSHMDPGYTHYDRRNLYATHDITNFLKPGVNTITAVLGNGFYNCQSRAVWDFENARWRDRPALICEIVTIDEGGSVKTAVATDSTWKTATGPYTYNNIYSGDRYDARQEWAGVSENGFDDSRWTNSHVVASPSSVLKAQSMPPIRPVEKIIPLLTRSWGDTVFVFDMGKNIAGVPSLNVKGPRGTKITVSSGEMLDTAGRLMLNNIDVYYRPVKPGEKFQTDEFILAGTGGKEYFAPEFTYHGFRYVEVKSDKPLTIAPEDVQGLFMHTDVQPVGHFSSSSSLLNSIYDATMLSYLGNLHSIPTDCPQREKNGWTADAHVAIDLALLNYDAITLYEKWMNDFADNQRRSGNISGIIPSSGWGYGQWPGPVWDAAMFIIPEALYDYYGDTRAIESLYPAMERYFHWCRVNETADSLLENGIGDWLSYKAQTPTPFTSSVYYYLDNVKMARFARLLGKDSAPYERKATSLKNKINEIFFNKADSTYANGTQAALGVALYAGIVPEKYEKAVAEKLRNIVVANDHFLDFGLLGSKTVLRMLTRYGYVDDAYAMATKTEAPSWGYWLTECGHTTLPETWLLSPQFNDASLNHVFMGDISAWMTSDLAGINFDPECPGFEHIIFRPHFPADLDSASAIYMSARGGISSSWKRDGNSIQLTVDVPHGCTATLELPEVTAVRLPGQKAVIASTCTVPAGRSVINITPAK